VLPPNFRLPYVSGDGKGDGHNTQLERAIFKALVDLATRQSVLCSQHPLTELVGAEYSHAAYSRYVCQFCRLSSKGPPSSWDVTYTSAAFCSHSRPTECFALTLKVCDVDVDGYDDETESTAFASPGFCSDHWQVGRATMTVLGFKPVIVGETKKGSGVNYTKWAQASGVRSSKEYAKERLRQLEDHIYNLPYTPGGPRGGQTDADRIIDPITFSSRPCRRRFQCCRRCPSCLRSTVVRRLKASTRCASSASN
jgi:hypothetical protein